MQFQSYSRIVGLSLFVFRKLVYWLLSQCHSIARNVILTKKKFVIQNEWKWAIRMFTENENEKKNRNETGGEREKKVNERKGNSNIYYILLNIKMIWNCMYEESKNKNVNKIWNSSIRMKRTTRCMFSHYIRFGWLYQVDVKSVSMSRNSLLPFDSYYYRLQFTVCPCAYKHENVRIACFRQYYYNSCKSRKTLQYQTLIQIDLISFLLHLSCVFLFNWEQNSE